LIMALVWCAFHLAQVGGVAIWIAEDSNTLSTREVIALVIWAVFNSLLFIAAAIATAKAVRFAWKATVGFLAGRSYNPDELDS